MLGCYDAAAVLQCCLLLAQAVLRGVLKPRAGSLTLDGCSSVAVGLLRLHLFPEAGILKKVIRIQRLTCWIDILGEKACTQHSLLSHYNTKTLLFSFPCRATWPSAV